MQPNLPIPVFSRQRGVGMIEVLVALLVMSIGVLGYAGLQLRALNSTEDAHYRTQAVAIAQDIVERIAANPAGLTTYTTAANWAPFNQGDAVPATWNACLGIDCTSTQMAQSDIQQATWTVAQLIPGGQVVAGECVGLETTCVTVAWGDTAPADCDPATGVECIRMEVVTWEP